MVAFASGFNLDLVSGQIYTTGLVLLGSNPSGADIAINNQKISSKTPYRLENIRTGSLDVSYTKQDYHPWKTNYLVRAGEVTFADYALLIPREIEPHPIDPQKSFAEIFNSQDGSRVFAVSNSPLGILEISDGSAMRYILDLSTNPTLKSAQTIRLLSINNDGSAMVIQLQHESSSAIYWVNTSTGELVDLTVLAPVLSSPKINPRNNREVLVLQNGQIQKIDITNRTIRDLPLRNVTSFNIDTDNLYSMENLNPTSDGQFYIRYDHNGNNRYVLAQYPTTQHPWQIQLSRWQGQNFSILVDLTSQSAHIVREVGGNNLTSNLGQNIKNISSSPDGRYINYIQGDELRTIDLESTERYHASTPGAITLSWLTNHQLASKKSDGLYIVDFTGQNLIKIPPNIPSGDHTLGIATSRNNKRIYYILDTMLYSYTLDPPKGLINFR